MLKLTKVNVSYLLKVYTLCVLKAKLFYNFSIFMFLLNNKKFETLLLFKTFKNVILPKFI